MDKSSIVYYTCGSVPYKVPARYRWIIEHTATEAEQVAAMRGIGGSPIVIHAARPGAPGVEEKTEMQGLQSSLAEDAHDHFVAADIEIEVVQPNHWKLHYLDMTAHFWPSKHSFYIFGKTARPKDMSPEYLEEYRNRLIQKWQGGAITMPDDAGQSQCNSCEMTIYWVVSDKGKNVAVEMSGENHFNNCGK